MLAGLSLSITTNPLCYLQLTVMYFLGLLATIALASQGASAATAFGWATGTTGGAAAAEAIPSSPQQLKQW
jgi:hypothetical protein